MNLRSAITVTIDITGIPKLLKKFYQGNELISKKSINPHSKKVDTNHNRDLVSQNEWLRQHLFNGVGKYLYCQRCILSIFGICSDRISRQRTIVRSI